jgi:hypothetical protein
MAPSAPLFDGSVAVSSTPSRPTFFIVDGT